MARLRRKATFGPYGEFPRGTPVYLSPPEAVHALPFGHEMCLQLGFRLVRFGDDATDRYVLLSDVTIPKSEEADWATPRPHPPQPPHEEGDPR